MMIVWLSYIRNSISIFHIVLTNSIRFIWCDIDHVRWCYRSLNFQMHHKTIQKYSSPMVLMPFIITMNINQVGCWYSLAEQRTCHSRVPYMAYPDEVNILWHMKICVLQAGVHKKLHSWSSFVIWLLIIPQPQHKFYWRLSLNTIRLNTSSCGIHSFHYNWEYTLGSLLVIFIKWITRQP